MVLMRETASAPDEAEANAVGRTSPLFGESLTVKGSVVTRRTDAVTVATVCAFVPKTAPPASTFGQDTFTSMPATPSTPSRSVASSTNSSMVPPEMLTITGVCHVAQIGAYFSMTV